MLYQISLGEMKSDCYVENCYDDGSGMNEWKVVNLGGSFIVQSYMAGNLNKKFMRAIAHQIKNILYSNWRLSDTEIMSLFHSLIIHTESNLPRLASKSSTFE